jgi:Tetratricopeptide repeat
VIVRAGLIAVAAAAIVLMAIWLSDFHSTNAATHTLLAPKATRAQLEQGIAEARHARRVNPSTDPDLAVYGLLVRLGRTAEARRVFEAIVRREPDNRTAWSLLAVTTQSTDPVQFRRALEHLHELSPITTRAP